MKLMKDKKIIVLSVLFIGMMYLNKEAFNMNIHAIIATMRKIVLNLVMRMGKADAKWEITEYKENEDSDPITWGVCYDPVEMPNGLECYEYDSNYCPWRGKMEIVIDPNAMYGDGVCMTLIHHHHVIHIQ